jgi:hypothetical protein
MASAQRHGSGSIGVAAIENGVAAAASRLAALVSGVIESGI